MDDSETIAEILTEESLWAHQAASDAAWLDVRYPGWHEKIDTDTLELSGCERCVAGQLGIRFYEMSQAAVADGHPIYLAGNEELPFLIQEIEQRRAKVLAEAFANASPERLADLGIQVEA